MKFGNILIITFSIKNNHNKALFNSNSIFSKIAFKLSFFADNKNTSVVGISLLFHNNCIFLSSIKSLLSFIIFSNLIFALCLISYSLIKSFFSTRYSNASLQSYSLKCFDKSNKVQPFTLFLINSYKSKYFICLCGRV